VVDQAERFGSTKQLCCYLGLVPGEHSSGGDGTEHRRGSITKVGDGRVRWLLVQAAHNLLRVPRPETTMVCMWAKKLESRRGRRIAIVALARRIAGILWAMMRDNKPYQATSYLPTAEETQQDEAA
jgi:transposase